MRTSTNISGHLLILCGLPGAGKTTYADTLNPDIWWRFSSDDWMEALKLSLWNTEARPKIEQLQWRYALRLLKLGEHVVIEWGTWSRGERDMLRTTCRKIGANVSLIYFDVPTETLWERIAERAREDPPIERWHLDEWESLFEAPDEDELALYDPLG